MGGATSASFSPDGARLVTAGVDGTVRVWNTSTGAEALTLKGHTARVNSASFSPDGKLVVTASDDSTARVWDAGPSEANRGEGGQKSIPKGPG